MNVSFFQDSRPLPLSEEDEDDEVQEREEKRRPEQPGAWWGKEEDMCCWNVMLPSRTLSLSLSNGASLSLSIDLMYAPPQGAETALGHQSCWSKFVDRPRVVF